MKRDGRYLLAEAGGRASAARRTVDRFVEFSVQGREISADHVFRLRARLVHRQISQLRLRLRLRLRRRPGQFDVAVQPAAETPVALGHGRDGCELAPHAVVTQGALDHARSVIGTGVTAVFAFQQFNLLVQQILRQLVSVQCKKKLKKKKKLQVVRNSLFKFERV